ncbi:MAG: hypothetical protein PF489_14575 [Salinivirgaceae bacterium]|nr:hypothetical protein [Salinivirgaceae bacterium]
MISAGVGGTINVIANWNDIDNWGEGFAYFGSGAVGAWISVQSFGLAAPVGMAITAGTNKFLETDVLYDQSIHTVTKEEWTDIGVSALIGGGAGYLGGVAGNKVATKVIEKGVKSYFLKEALVNSTSNAVTGGLDGFFQAKIVEGKDYKESFISGGIGFSAGLAFGLTYSSLRYVTNKSGVKTTWDQKEIEFKLKNQGGDFENYYEYNFNYKNATPKPSSPWNQYNPNPMNSYPRNNWAIPINEPVKFNNFDLK